MILPADTLRPDTVLLSAMRADSHYDYSRELVPSDNGVWDVLMRKFDEMVSKLFEGVSTGDPTTLIIVIAILVLIVIAAVFIVKNPNLFYKNKKLTNDADSDEDNIYGVDFEKEIADGRKRGDWRRVVRMIYLRTLRVLADGKIIDWRPSKTPTQYTYEVRTDEFRQMTREFLRVRYGGFPADEAMAENMEKLSTAVSSLANDDVSTEKGGEQ